MTRSEHGRRLMSLLQQLAPMQRRLGNEGIVIIIPKHSTGLQTTDNPNNRLQLSPRFRNRLFINDKRLNEKFIRQFLQSTLISYRSSEEEQSKTRLGHFALVIQGSRELMDELEEGGQAGLIVGLILERLESSG